MYFRKFQINIPIVYHFGKIIHQSSHQLPCHLIFADVDAMSANFADEYAMCTIFFFKNSHFIKITFKKICLKFYYLVILTKVN